MGKSQEQSNRTNGLRKGLGRRGFWGPSPLLAIVAAGAILIVLWGIGNSLQMSQKTQKEEELFGKIKSEDALSRWATNSEVLKFESDINALKAESEILDLDESRLTFPVLDLNVKFEM